MKKKQTINTDKLTAQQIEQLFMDKVGELPDQSQIYTYANYSIEELTTVLNRRIAAEKDPTYYQRVAEDHIRYMAASLEEQQAWKMIEPRPPV